MISISYLVVGRPKWFGKKFLWFVDPWNLGWNRAIWDFLCAVAFSTQVCVCVCVCVCVFCVFFSQCITLILYCLWFLMFCFYPKDYVPQWRNSTLTPSLPQAIHFPDWRVHPDACKHFSHQAYNKPTFNTVHFDAKPSSCWKPVDVKFHMRNR